MQGFDLTILQKQVDRLQDAYNRGRFSDAFIAALNTGNGLMQIRIFSDNTDIIGGSFGSYIDPRWRRKRTGFGRQITRKDLEFSGALRKSIMVEADSAKSAILAFSTTSEALIAHGQEQQITNIRNGRKGTTSGSDRIRIFGFSEDEKNEVVSQGLQLINQILNPK